MTPQAYKVVNNHAHDISLFISLSLSFSLYLYIIPHLLVYHKPCTPNTKTIFIPTLPPSPSLYQYSLSTSLSISISISHQPLSILPPIYMLQYVPSMILYAHTDPIFYYLLWYALYSPLWSSFSNILCSVLSYPIAQIQYFWSDPIHFDLLTLIWPGSIRSNTILSDNFSLIHSICSDIILYTLWVQYNLIWLLALTWSDIFLPLLENSNF